MRQVERHQLQAILEALHSADLIVGQVQNGELTEVEEALHAVDLVLVQIQAPHLGHVVEIFDNGDTVALEPDRLALRVCVKILNLLETCIQIERGGG